MDAGAAAACLLPTQLNTASHGPGLEIFCDKLTVHYKGEGRHATDVGSIQANRPVPLRRSLYYFEVTMLERGEMGRIAVGFTDKSFKLNKQPGWEPDSYGYHGDDGKKFGGSAKGEEYGPKFTKGDTIGAAYNLAKQEIFFTKNGNRLRTAFRTVKGELFPTLGLHSKGELVRVNFGQHPFKFDIEAMVSEERCAQASAIDRVSVSPHTAHQIVRQYLLHYGYGDTLGAFDAEAGFRAEEEAAGEGGEGGAGEGAAAARPNGVGRAEGEDGGPCSMAVDQEPDLAAGPSDTAEQTQPAGTAAAAAAGGGAAGNGSTATNGPASATTAAAGSMAVDGEGPAAEAAGASGGQEGVEVWRCGGRDWMRDGALPVRQFVRRAIMEGRVQAAVDCISHTFPQVLQGGPGLESVQYHLATQQYIELVRSGDVEAAVAFAQGTLATLLARATSRSSSAGGGSPSPSSPPTPAAAAPPLALTASTAALGATSTAAGAEGAGGAGGAAGSASRSGLGSGDALNEAALRDVVALVAYERPEASPLAWLLGQEQRERVADAVNAALLWQAYGGQGEGLRKSCVELLLCQLATVQDTAFELNGSQGEPFELEEHLLPHEAPDDHAMSCN